MKNIFNNKKMFFAIGVIVGACLMIIFSFAIPGIRTYVGREAALELEMPHEMGLPIPEQEFAKESGLNEQGDVSEPSVQIASAGKEVPKVPGEQEIQNLEKETPKPGLIIPSGIIPEKAKEEEQSVGTEVAEKSTPAENPMAQIVTNEDIMNYYKMNKEYFKKE